MRTHEVGTREYTCLFERTKNNSFGAYFCQIEGGVEISTFIIAAQYLLLTKTSRYCMYFADHPAAFNLPNKKTPLSQILLDSGAN